MLIGYLIYIILIMLNAIAYLNSVRIKGVEICSLVFLIMMMGGNVMNADYENYAYWYESGDYPIVIEPGYQLVASLFANVGFSFIVFHFIFVTASILLGMRAISKLIDNYHLLLTFYLSYNIIIDTIQIRNTMATAFLLTAIVCMVDGKKWKSALFLTIASSFHFSFLLFFVLLLYRPLDIYVSKYTMRFVIVVTCMCGIAALSTFLQDNFGAFVSIIWNESKAVYVKSKLFNIVYLLFPFLSFLLVSICRDYMSIDIEQSDDGDDNSPKTYADILYGIYAFLLLISPILILSQDTLRIHRDMNVGLVVMVTIAFQSIWFKVDDYKGRFSPPFTIVLALSLFCLWMIGGQAWPNFHEVFGNNYFFNDNNF